MYIRNYKGLVFLIPKKPYGETFVLNSQKRIDFLAMWREVARAVSQNWVDKLRFSSISI